MPKVSPEHKQRRREEILEGAQRAFARHGYEGATVARLEEETGLSRGAIFSYFENKDALFVAVVAESSDRLVGIWLERGFRALLDALANGLAFARVTGDELPDLDALNRLVETGAAPR